MILAKDRELTEVLNELAKAKGLLAKLGFPEQLRNLYLIGLITTPLQNSALKSKTTKILKAFELEQSKSAWKVQIEKEKSLKSLARSLTVWLNFLLENPGSCGCNVTEFTGEVDRSGGGVGGANEILVNNGKRDSLPSRGVGVDGPWRGLKRQKD
ncbi:abnormal spindle-like microcephaly-associated protein-like protein [Forsythia ovata]|uniref:Abnormal spindle-like microcephaly-associated protein-like protein n=1 Tax=Forsythia ovata TaxID=205694 RepID=A0ABD1RIE9_9LAMI